MIAWSLKTPSCRIQSVSDLEQINISNKTQKARITIEGSPHRDTLAYGSGLKWLQFRSDDPSEWAPESENKVSKAFAEKLRSTQCQVPSYLLAHQ